MSDWNDCVNSEGGPILLADPDVAQRWRGVDEDSGAFSYSTICSVFDRDPNIEGFEWQVQAETVFIWEMRGAGTATVHVAQPSTVLILRVWVDDDSQLDGLLTAAWREQGSPLGHLILRNPCLFVGWAVESGTCLKRNANGVFEIDTAALSMSSTATLVPTPPGRYSISHVDLTSAGAIGRCLRLTRISGEVSQTWDPKAEQAQLPQPSADNNDKAYEVSDSRADGAAPRCASA